jgi:RNA polymerase sporulation-specific sigma factor
MGTDGDIVYRSIEEQVDRSLLDDAIERLSTREKKIVELRYGLGDGKEKTQKEVADLLGISQAQVSRLEKAALKHMRRYV